MRIFSTEPNGNERAQFVGADYIQYSIPKIEFVCDRMRNNDEICQSLLAIIDFSRQSILKKDEGWSTHLTSGVASQLEIPSGQSTSS